MRAAAACNSCTLRRVMAQAVARLSARTACLVQPTTASPGQATHYHAGALARPYRSHSVYTELEFSPCWSRQRSAGVSLTSNPGVVGLLWRVLYQRQPSTTMDALHVHSTKSATVLLGQGHTLHFDLGCCSPTARFTHTFVLLNQCLTTAACIRIACTCAKSVPAARRLTCLC